MSVLNPILGFIKRRVSTTIFLALYFIWWSYCFYLFHRISDEPERSCGAANGMLVILIFLVFVIYFIITLILMVINKGQKRKDFAIALSLVILPLVIAIIDMKT